MNSRRTAVVVSLSVLLLVSGCSEATPETSTSSTLGEVPGPHKATCDLADEAQLILEEVGRAGLRFIGDAARAEGMERADRLHVLAGRADVVATVDPWAHQVADVANALGLGIDRIIADRTASDPEKFVGTSARFDALLSLCDTTQ